MHGISVAGGTFPARSGTSSCRSPRAATATTSRSRRARSAGPRSSASTRRAAPDYAYGGEPYNYGDSTGGGYQGYDPRLYGEPSGRPSMQQPDRHRERQRRSRRRRRRWEAEAPGVAGRRVGGARAAAPRLRRAGRPVGGAGSNVVLATSGGSPDWLLGPVRAARRGVRRRQPRPARSSTPGCGSRCSRTAACSSAHARASAPRTVVAAIVGGARPVRARAAAALAGRVQLHRVRAARRGARPRPVHAQPVRRTRRRGVPLRRVEGLHERLRPAVHASPRSRSRRPSVPVRVLGAEGRRRAGEPRRSSRSCGGAPAASAATRACRRWSSA